MEGKLPEEFLRVLGPDQTLRQGRKNVGKQFSYAVTHTADKKTYGYWASFRSSFAVMAFVSDFDALDSAAPDGVFRPGFLRGFKITELPFGRWPGQFGVPFKGDYAMKISP